MVLDSSNFCHSYKVPEAGNFANKGGLPPGVVGHIWNPSTREIKAGKREREGQRGKQERKRGIFFISLYLSLCCLKLTLEAPPFVYHIMVNDKGRCLQGFKSLPARYYLL